MNLKPLGNRILIKPHKAPEQTESGLYVCEHKKPEQSGVVIAVGTPTHPRKLEAEALAWSLADIHNTGTFMSDTVLQASDLLFDLVRREPCVKVGDDVIFSWQSGQTLTVDGEEFLLMPEDDILCVLEGVE